MAPGQRRLFSLNRSRTLALSVGGFVMIGVIISAVLLYSQGLLPPSRPILYGQVTDEAGLPLSNVTIRTSVTAVLDPIQLMGAKTHQVRRDVISRTDEHGMFAVEAPGPVSGLRILEFSLPGFEFPARHSTDPPNFTDLNVIRGRVVLNQGRGDTPERPQVYVMRRTRGN